jgi:hypothetical protein
MKNFDSGFQNMDTSVYKTHREKYLPKKIKCLFIAESPPAFKGDTPVAYFYFSDIPKADSLFYTIIKAIYDIDFDKHVHSRIEVLTQFCKDGYYLIDSVDYPINKDKQFIDIDNDLRELIIRRNKQVFDNHINRLINLGYIVNTTKSILIKGTVYNQHFNNSLLRVANPNFIGFPRYIKDRETIEAIRKII